MEERFARTFDEFMSLKLDKGGKFFKLKNGEEARVRFMYDDFSDMSSYVVHEFQNPYALITCGNPNKDPNVHCKWCENGSYPSEKIILAIYNIDSNEIQYWTRTLKYAKERVIPMLQEVAAQNQPLVSQVYKVKRSGESLNTDYAVVPTGQPDGQTKSAFGTVESPYDVNMIKPYDYDYQANVGQQNVFSNNNGFSNNFNNQGFGNNPPQATRKTVAFM